MFAIESGTICEIGKYDERLKRNGKLHYLGYLQSGTSVVSA